MDIDMSFLDGSLGVFDSWCNNGIGIMDGLDILSDNPQ